MSAGYAVRNDGQGYRGVNDESEVMEHEHFSLTEPDISEEVAELAQTTKLRTLTTTANAQKAALTNRISTINDAIDFDEVLPEELVELPIRQAQLVTWKKYAVQLGRVTAQPGWYQTVSWPEAPADGIDLNVTSGTQPAAV